LLLIVAVVAGGYWVWKFGPVYYNRYKVDEILQEGRSEATGIARMSPQGASETEAKIIAGITERVEARGLSLETNQLAVYFDGDYETLNVDYVVVIRHLLGQPTTMKMHRSVSVPE
jgi:hypothetical protein